MADGGENACFKEAQNEEEEETDKADIADGDAAEAKNASLEVESFANLDSTSVTSTTLADQSLLLSPTQSGLLPGVVSAVEERRDSTISLTSGRRRRWQSIGLDNYEPDYYSYNYELENDLLDLSGPNSGTLGGEHATTSSSTMPFPASIPSSTTTSTSSSSSSFMAQVTSSSNNLNTGYWRKWEEDKASGVDSTGAHKAEVKKQRLIDFDFVNDFDGVNGEDDTDQMDEVQQQQMSEFVNSNRSQQLFLQQPFVDADKFLASLDQAQIDFDQATSNNIINNLSTLNSDPKMPQLQKLPVTGLRQSPIDIQAGATAQKTRQKRSVNEGDGVAPLTIDYSAISGANGLTLENTGHGWKLNIPDEVARKCPITGGPLGNDEYRLLQIHSHWGKDASCGSEHTLNGQSFPCEVHLVHWNASKYANPLEAMECTNDGLAVVGVFVRLSEIASEPLNVIINALPEIAFCGNSIALTQTGELDLNQLVPSREVPKYFNYEGSLTTPPFSESVIWIVMEEPIDAQEEQICKFREMKKNEPSAEEAICKENYRKVQSLNARNIAYFD